MFIDDITDHLSDLLTVNQNNLIIGDFNMHADDSMDSEANIFNDIIIAYRLKQHVMLPTHNLGNTLDFMFIEIIDKISIGKVETGSTLSDHKLVFAPLSNKKASPNQRENCHKDH